MESENLANLPQEDKVQRPTLLSVLCVLTFIGSGCSLLSYLSMGMSFGTLRQLVLETDTYEAYFNMAPNVRAAAETLFSLPGWYFLIAGLLYASSLAGAILMWRLKRMGFHIYTIAQCLLILFEMLMVPGTGVPFGAIVWTGLFVAGYAANLKHMKY